MAPNFLVFIGALLLGGLGLAATLGAWTIFAILLWVFAIGAALVFFTGAQSISMPKQELDVEYNEQANYYRNGGK
jgi:energy-converting hydrogenase Eha subunit B